MMKKMLVAFTSLVLAGTSTLMAQSLDWGSASWFTQTIPTTDIVDRNGANIPAASNFLVVMYKTANPGVVDPSFLGGLDAPTTYTGIVGNTVFGPVDNLFIKGVSPYSTPATGDIFGQEVYSVVFEGPAIVGAGGWYAVADTPTTLPTWDETGLPPVDALAYNIGTVVQSDWRQVAVIPEPGTFVVMALGGLFFLVRRKIKR